MQSPKFSLAIGMFPERVEVGMDNEDECTHYEYESASQIDEFTPESEHTGHGIQRVCSWWLESLYHNEARNQAIDSICLLCCSII